MSPMESLLELFRELDAELASRGWACRGCSACCRFGEFGHALFLSSLEADLLIGDDVPEHAEEGTCVFLVDGRCSRRGRRALGCRTFYCAEAGKGEIESLTEHYTKRLKELHERSGTPWCYMTVASHANRRKSRARKE
jgi:hypothetical protein